MRLQLKQRTEKLVNTIPEKDLVEFTDLVEEFITKRNKKIIENFAVGDEVFFMQGVNRDNKISGTIIKIKEDSAEIKTPENRQWTVPAYLLKKEKYLKGA